jgi:hypothetical protein
MVCVFPNAFFSKFTTLIGFYSYCVLVEGLMKKNYVMCNFTDFSRAYI